MAQGESLNQNLTKKKDCVICSESKSLIFFHSYCQNKHPDEVCSECWTRSAESQYHNSVKCPLCRREILTKDLLLEMHVLRVRIEEINKSGGFTNDAIVLGSPQTSNLANFISEPYVTEVAFDITTSMNEHEFTEVWNPVQEILDKIDSDLSELETMM